MIATSRLSSVAQVAGVAAAALVCYLVSQTVAAERAALARVDRQIADTGDAIARLQTEISVRSRQPQLERWNGQVLSLKAPKPRQFVADSVQLVSEFSIGGPRPAPLDPAITSQVAVTKVSLPQPAAPAPAAPALREIPAPVAEPMVRTAAFVRPRMDRLAAEADEMVKASYRAPSAPAPDKPAAAKPDKAVAADKPDKIAVEERSAKVAAPGKSAKLASAEKPAKTAPGDKAAKTERPTRLASLLPADIGALAAAERSGAKPPRGR